MAHLGAEEISTRTCSFK